MADNPKTFRTDLRRVRYLGSAHSGTRHLWHMRLTSMALIPLTIAFVWLILTLVGKDYNAVRATMSRPFPALLTLAFLLTSIYHMEQGMRAIIEDYVHGEKLREASLALNLFFCVAIGLACAYAALKISFV